MTVSDRDRMRLKTPPFHANLPGDLAHFGIYRVKHPRQVSLKIAHNSLIRFSAASSSFFLAAFLRLPPSSFCSIKSFINRASCLAA